MAQNKIEQDIAAIYALLSKVASALGISTDTQSALLQRQEAEEKAAAHWAVGGAGYNELHGIKPKQEKQEAQAPVESVAADKKEAQPVENPEPKKAGRPSGSGSK